MTDNFMLMLFADEWGEDDGDEIFDDELEELPNGEFSVTENIDENKEKSQEE